MIRPGSWAEGLKLLLDCSEPDRARLDREVDLLVRTHGLGAAREELLAAARALESATQAPETGRRRLRLWAAVLRQRAAALA